MRNALWGALLTVVILVGVAPAAQAAVTTCADGTTNCDPYTTDQTDSNPTWGTSGQSVICRATWGNPATYCFIETFVWSEAQQAWVPGPCSRGYTNSGWCTCEIKTRKLGGSCTFRS